MNSLPHVRVHVHESSSNRGATPALWGFEDEDEDVDEDVDVPE